MEFFLTMTDRTQYHDYYTATIDECTFATGDSSKGVDRGIDITLRTNHKEYTVKSVERCGLDKLTPNMHKCLIHNPYSMGYVQQLNAGKNLFNKKLYTHLAYGDLFFDMYHVPVPNENYSMLCIYKDDEIIAVAYLDNIREKGRSSYRVVCSKPYQTFVMLLLLYYDRYLSMFSSKDVYYGATTINPVTDTDFLDKMPDQHTINQLYVM